MNFSPNSRLRGRNGAEEMEVARRFDRRKQWKRERKGEERRDRQAENMCSSHHIKGRDLGGVEEYKVSRGGRGCMSRKKRRGGKPSRHNRGENLLICPHLPLHYSSTQNGVDKEARGEMRKGRSP